MFLFSPPIVALLSAATLTAGHGNVISPPARIVGAKMREVCGGILVNVLTGDINNNQQQLEQVSAIVDFSNCNILYLSS